MLVTCLKCKKPVFVSSSVLGSGEATVPCNACQASLVISESGSVRIDEAQAARPPPPPPDEAVAPESKSALGIGSSGQSENFAHGNGQWQPTTMTAPEPEPEETTVDLAARDLVPADEETTVDLAARDLVPADEETTAPDVMAAAAEVPAPEAPAAPPRPITAPPAIAGEDAVTVPGAPAQATDSPSAPETQVAAAPAAAPEPEAPLPEFAPGVRADAVTDAAALAAEQPPAQQVADEAAPAPAVGSPNLDSNSSTPGEYQIVAPAKPAQSSPPVEAAPPEPMPEPTSERVPETPVGPVDVSQRTDNPKAGPVRDMPWKVQAPATDAPIGPPAESHTPAVDVEPAPEAPVDDGAAVESWTVAAGGAASLTDGMPSIPMDGTAGRSGTIKLDENMLTGGSRRTWRLPVAALCILLLAGGGLWAAEIVHIPGVSVPAAISGLFGGDTADAGIQAGPMVAMAQPAAAAAAQIDPEPAADPGPGPKPDPDAGGTAEAAAAVIDDAAEDPDARRPGNKRRKRGPRGTVRNTGSSDSDPGTETPSPTPAAAPVAAKPAGDSQAMQHYKQGNAFLKEKKVALAIEEFKTSLAKDPRHGLAYRSLGVAYMLLGREKSAVSAYERFVALEPGHRDAIKVEQIITDYYGRNPK